MGKGSWRRCWGGREARGGALEEEKGACRTPLLPHPTSLVPRLQTASLGRYKERRPGKGKRVGGAWRPQSQGEEWRDGELRLRKRRPPQVPTLERGGEGTETTGDEGTHRTLSASADSTCEQNSPSPVVKERHQQSRGPLALASWKGLLLLAQPLFPNLMAILPT